jgi:hypothetical protein
VIRQPAHPNAACQRKETVGLTAVTGRVIIQDTPPLPARSGERDRRKFRAIGEKATDVLRRLEERPGSQCTTPRIIRLGGSLLKRKMHGDLLSP